ncbi:homologous-pairing protein 2 homolog [Dermatophagoides pteronyssinus]|uniref:Homologous-pairing protein 2 homolog n=1 Tax=Dermatophagoides pteronyssinus TaxID=6956 RepID=A0A6P6XQK2_DERPT|nr:homologous-pairing protein 2 homolog [Dermatophagoides pteronyssinus]
MSKNNIDDAKLEVKNFLINANRPYSCQDVANNFQNKYNKSLIQKSLDLLVEQNDVTEKLNGKQKIYFISQTNTDFNEESMKKVQEKIEQHNQLINDLKQSINDKQIKLNELKSQKSIEELQNHLDRLRNEIDELRQKSEEFNESKNITVEENIDDNLEKKSRLTVKRKKLIDEWRKRKRMATGIIQTIMENCPKKKKDFFEEVGIETDEDYNVIIPSNV